MGRQRSRSHCARKTNQRPTDGRVIGRTVDSLLECGVGHDYPPPAEATDGKCAANCLPTAIARESEWKGNGHGGAASSRSGEIRRPPIEHTLACYRWWVLGAWGVISHEKKMPLRLPHN